MSSSPSNSPAFDIAVIIVTYFSDGVILPCLQSLSAAHPTAKMQIIVVDNHSTDATLEKVKGWNPGSDRLQLKVVANQRNRGFTAAVNQGLQLAEARFILFLNPDTVLPPGSLQTLLQRMEADPRIAVAAPQLRNPDGSVQPSCRRFPRRRDVLFHMLGLPLLFPHSPRWNYWKMGDFSHQEARPVEQPQGACLLARADVVRTVGPWDESYFMFFSDVDWCRRVQSSGFEIWFLPEVHVIHHQGKSVKAHRPRMILSSHLSFVRYFWKQQARGRYILYNLAVTLLLLVTAPVRMLIATFPGTSHK